MPCSDRTAFLGDATASLADGAHALRLTVTDAASNSTVVSRTIKTDNTAPGRITPAVLGGQAWRRSNGFTVRWANAPQTHAPITRVRYKLCPPSGTNCVIGSKDGMNIEELSNLPVKALGDNTLKLWLEDEAGNQTEALASDPSHLRLDPDPPRLAFLPQDSSDPLTVSVRATDPLSGVSGGQIEMRARGGRTWHELDTRVERGRLLAEIDDERFRNGTYDFRARAGDRAGNEASTGARTDGARAAVRLPVRISTGLRAGFPKTKVKRRRGKRRRIRVLARRATFSLGRRTVVRGTLANPDGQPIDGAFITVFSRRDLPGGGFDPVAFIRTDSRGRFSYRAKATDSRTLRFRYGGTRRIRSATSDVVLRVRAASTIRVDRTRLVNGEVANFSGRVRTRPIPTAGKLIEIQAFFRRRWRTVSTTRTDAAGRWTFPYQFGATTQTVRYRFRVRLPREGGYPFATGRSRTALVTVRGL